MNYLSKYFTYDELTFSDTAKRLRLNNEPSAKLLKSLINTAGQLDRVRELLGCPVVVTSGYRSTAVNRVIGSNDKSQHTKCEAVDFRTNNHTPHRIVELIKQSNIEYDQLILEFDSWVHISFSANNRKQVLIIDENGTRAFK